jgi:hypothetical protein
MEDAHRLKILMSTSIQPSLAFDFASGLSAHQLAPGTAALARLSYSL